MEIDGDVMFVVVESFCFGFVIVMYVGIFDGYVLIFCYILFDVLVFVFRIGFEVLFM